MPALFIFSMLTSTLFSRLSHSLNRKAFHCSVHVSERIRTNQGTQRYHPYDAEADALSVDDCIGGGGPVRDSLKLVVRESLCVLLHRRGRGSQGPPCN